mmetsp:Transcript_83807/g.260446  ORF Transcript_83807/g.260446 Transcript_83807/m.260446 type:complete len:691 (+) Transcript_83807:56-2128(+)
MPTPASPGRNTVQECPPAALLLRKLPVTRPIAAGVVVGLLHEGKQGDSWAVDRPDVWINCGVVAKARVVAGEQHIAGHHPLARLVVPVGHGEALKELRREGRAHGDEVAVRAEGLPDPVVVGPLLVLPDLADLPDLEVVLRDPVQLLLLHLEPHVVEVDGVEPDGLLGTLHRDVVNQAADHRHLVAAEVEHEVRDEDPDPELLRGRLQARRHVDVRGEVRGVDLQLAADGALDGPAAVQAEAHAHAVALQALQQARVAAVLREHAGLVDLSHDLDERQHGHVRELRLLVRGGSGEAPDGEEGLADVLVGCAVEVVDATVDDLAHLVDEDHDLLPEHVGRQREVADAAEADDGVDLLPGHHGVHAGAVAAAHVLAYDLGAGLPEAQGEEPAELDDGLLQDDGLHGLLDLLHAEGLVKELPDAAHVREPLPALRALLLLTSELPVAELDRLQGVVLDGLHLGDHPLYGVQQQLVGVHVEGPRADAHGKADEDGLEHAQARLKLRDGPAVEGEHHVHVPLLRVALREGHEVVHLRAAKLLVHGAHRGVLAIRGRGHGDAQEDRAAFCPGPRKLDPHARGQRHHLRHPPGVHVPSVPLGQRGRRVQRVRPQKPGLVELRELREVGPGRAPHDLDQGRGVEAQPEELREAPAVVLVGEGQEVLLVPRAAAEALQLQAVGGCAEATKAPRQLRASG